ncbi:MAG: glucose sorbosone dehydrogenase [Candidatus Latescibacteria bacterium]|nr:glucose sorbosone dehydrogenase [Candidatus Latescibacterota bacterium]NIM21811.1 glucose sorbosone dehydrogenase [Candidatus Latescibacterota bacterium]NIM65949.1 glucose sorbosone dehydrogenase [Candidatus Latescibacterota bacterium]NIO02694.1 glucose sorbosone dehydrogenase [Candidatus Latescibacterota bacterium]NIO29675.1 glucose sorbosone dehydrogenase [Candidatus Latescibacterota bacterium]
MIARYISSLFFVLALAACSDDKTQNPVDKSNVGFGVDTAFHDLSFERPVDLQDPKDGSNRLFVVEQAGRIIVFENSPSVNSSKVFLDIRGRVNDAGNEQGLLGLAFHPSYTSNGHFYAYYSATDSTRLSRFQVSGGDPDAADPSSEKVLLSIYQPFSNHNGGQIAFGPDGDLYIAVGDGGGAGDPLENGQDQTSLLGSILRIDVDTGNPFTIPPDNPYAGNTQGFREEIYAYGLRNPWRFSFDPVTGWLWAGDVGQNAIEEVDIVESGGNYGWDVMEGSSCFEPSSGCDQTDLILPVWEYPHSVGRSITGGYVYRGTAIPELVGAYIYGDFITGKIWALRFDGVNPATNTELIDADFNISSFGVDGDGEIYICAFDGKIHKLIPDIGP